MRVAKEDISAWPMLLAIMLLFQPALADDTVDQLRKQLELSLAGLDRVGVLGSVISVSIPGRAPITAANGFADMEHKTSVGENHLFQIGSQTKMFTAAALLLLERQGKLDIDDLVSTYVDGVPREDELTIRQLLKHTGGIGDSITYFDPPLGRRPDFDVTFERHLFLGRVAGEQFAPGAGWSYNNLGFVVLGQVIEAVSGQALNDYIHARILEPLEMRETFVGNLEAYPEQQMARGYFVDDRTQQVIDSTTPNLTWASSAGDMVSSLADMRKWAQALLDSNNAIGISLADFASDTIDVTNFGNLDGYGLGMMRRDVAGQQLWGHGGYIHGYVTLTLVEPSSGIVVQLMTNLARDSEQVIAALEMRAAVALNLAQFASAHNLR